MQLSTISTDLLLIHVVPLLNHSDIRALAQCNRSLTIILNPIRLQKCSVRKPAGYFRMHLSRPTVRTIREITLNGSSTEHDDVFQCRDLAGVRSAIIVTPILPRQRVVFGRWARRLHGLREDSVDEVDDPISSIGNLAAGCLQQVRNLRLNIALPERLDRMLSLARRLERIQLIPEQLESHDGYVRYLAQVTQLMCLLHDHQRLPSLKIVHIAPSFVSSLQEKIPHQEMLKKVWAAVFSHGGWQLVSSLPTAEISVPYPTAWGSWWATHGVGFTITLKEARQFVSACLNRNIQPRLHQYVKGPIHIQTGGGTPEIGTLPGTAIYGVWIHHGPTTNITAALRLITPDTKVLVICLRSYSGSVGSLIPDARPYQSVQGLMFDGPFPSHDLAQFRYADNLCVAFIKAFQLPSWACLVNLSLPAVALQRGLTDGLPCLSLCGLHIGGYDMTVLSTLPTLKALAITQWLSCTGCKIHPCLTLEHGFLRLPRTVEYITLSGRMGYRGEKVPPRVLLYSEELHARLLANGMDLLLNCDELVAVRLGMYPDIL